MPRSLFLVMPQTAATTSRPPSRGSPGARFNTQNATFVTVRSMITTPGCVPLSTTVSAAKPRPASRPFMAGPAPATRNSRIGVCGSGEISVNPANPCTVTARTPRPNPSAARQWPSSWTTRDATNPVAVMAANRYRRSSATSGSRSRLGPINSQQMMTANTSASGDRYTGTPRIRPISKPGARRGCSPPLPATGGLSWWTWSG